MTQHDLTKYQDALKKASSTIEQLLAENDRLKHREPMAIIGMGCRLPGGADSPEEFWRLLSEGRDGVGLIPEERWPADRYYDENAAAPGKMYTRQGSFLTNSPYDFDPAFFGISPKEAKALDPQQRLLLEVAWEALEDAGINPASLQGSRTGVFVGISSNDYDLAHLKSSDPGLIDPYSLTGFTFSLAAGRISYTLGLEGPSVPVDTACSSSLVALHLACRSLQSGECDMALVGGVNLMLAPEPLIAFCKLRALSPDGRCKTFDATADGYGRGEGCGMIVLKRLETAQQDGDRVLALVKGSALNNDGRSNGLTAPNGLAQRRVIAAALEDAALQPEDLDYIEAHGTGTPLGDPIEIEAIAAVLGKGRDAKHPLLVGSAKTNIGHLEAAAGIAGIIKLVLSLQREKIPPHLNFSTPSPHIAWDSLPLRVVSKGAGWPRAGRPRRAGISGFGFSGTNAHVILEEAPLGQTVQSSDLQSCHLLQISAADESALRELARKYVPYLQKDSLPSLAAICNTAAIGRNRFSHAVAVTGETPQELAQKLSTFAAQGSASGLYLHSPQDAGKPGPVFLFTGQGSQYPGMGQELYRTSPVYRDSMDRCDSLFAPLLGISIRDLMHNGSEEQLARTIYTQPAIFALEYSLAQLWQSWGVKPSAVLGHSIGELVAACIAGVLSLEDAVTLVAHRGRLMDALPAGGVMAAVLCQEAKVLQVIAPYGDTVSVAAVNAPGSVVISGEQAGISAVLELFTRQGISSQYLTVSHAFHSHLMDPVLDQFERVASGLTFHAPLIPVISNVTGLPAVGDDLQTPLYWRRHLRGSVRFSDSIQFLKQQGHDLFLELGATATLSSFVRQTAGSSCSCSASLKRGVSPWSTVSSALGELFAAGQEIDWNGYDAPYNSGKASLPTYPFQCERHIMNPVRELHGRVAKETLPCTGERHPLLGGKLDSPLQEQCFAGSLGLSQNSWLAGHAICGAVILPAAAYLEMALAAMQVPGGSPFALQEIGILAPMVLTEEALPLQTIHRPQSGDVEIYSRENDQKWKLHARMAVHPLPAPLFSSLDLISVTNGYELDGELLYGDLLEKGYCYGGLFRSIRKLTIGEGNISGFVEIPHGAAQGFILHPALLDGCLTMAGASLLHDAEPIPEGALFVPASIDSLLFSGRSTESLKVQCVRRQRNLTSATFDIYATDGEDRPLLQITGLTLRRMGKNQLVPREPVAVADLMYRLEWREKGLPSLSIPPSGTWIVLTDSSPLSETVFERLVASSVTATRIRGVDNGEAASPGRLNRLSPTVMEKFARDLKENGEPVKGIISLWGDSAAGNLHLVQGLLAAGFAPPLLLVTSGVHDPLGMEREVRPEGAALWGFGASVASEAPELSCRLLDISPWPGSDELALLVNELGVSDGEERVVLRGRGRFVPRLCPSDKSDRSDRLEDLQLPEYDGFYLDVEQRGSLDGLCIRLAGRRAPVRGEAEVQVRAIGLNFRDVLNVLGRYPGDPGIPGFECSGVITGVGPDVAGFAVGDRVCVFNHDGCITDYLTLSTAHLIKIPALWSFEEAAAVPVAFLTAWYGLCHLGGIKNGDRVLIHAAAGGVGLAAVQLCRAAGAVVFATAGSPEKRELLRQMGVQQVMDSRSLAFADLIGRADEGPGVDIVLNSLAGEFIEQSLALLAPGGRFIEIGKSDSRSDHEIQELYPHLSYHRFDLAAIAEQDPALVSGMFGSMFDLFADGRLTPLPMTIFPVQRARNAFRFMSQARHIGKVVISMADRLRERRLAEQGLIDPHGSYLISGGLGALGLAVARWLVDQGGRYLVLVGRHAPAGEAAAVIEELRLAGTNTVVMQGDVAKATDVARIISGLRGSIPPLKGIIHAAGILDDALLPELDAPRLERIMEPKLAGAWNLHTATEKDELDLFVLFSSLTSVTGSPGQAGYAAANAALDGFARWRRSRGLPAVSIQWGPWGETGMAAQEGKAERLSARGIRSVTTAVALQALETVLRANRTEQIVADLDLPRLAAFIPSGAAGLYADLLSRGEGVDTDGNADPLDQLRQALPAERPEIMLLTIRELAARVMGQSDPGRIDVSRPLQEQGFDSLMAVDLRNLIARSFKVELPVSLLFDYPTPEKIGHFLLSDVLTWPEAGEPVAVVPATAAVYEKSADDLVDEIEQLLAG